MSQSDSPRARSGFPLATAALGAWAVLLSAMVILGSDLMWVVALGDVIRADGTVPAGIPFASAPQIDWHNPIVLAEVLLSVVNSFGPVALAALQVVIVAGVLVVILVEGRRTGAGELHLAVVLSLVVIGGSAAFVITRLPSLSLLPFALAVALMRRQHSHPDNNVWWLIPLYIVWGNLHGAVLVGLAVLGVFLVVSRGGGPWPRRLGLGLGCSLSLVITSAGLSTPAYYLNALRNEAAARGSDLWARPDLTHPLDVALIGAIVVLLVLAVRRPTPLWEWLVVVGIAVATFSAARNGIWLLLFIAPAALRARRGDRAAAGPRWQPGLVMAVTFVLSVVGASWLLTRREASVLPPGTAAVTAIRHAADGKPVLADEPLAETLGQAGLIVWMANPIDAFPRPLQGEFLDFLHDGKPPPSASDVDVAAVSEALAPDILAAGGWREVSREYGFVVLRRSP